MVWLSCVLILQIPECLPAISIDLGGDMKWQNVLTPEQSQCNAKNTTEIMVLKNTKLFYSSPSLPPFMFLKEAINGSNLLVTSPAFLFNLAQDPLSFNPATKPNLRLLTPIMDDTCPPRPTPSIKDPESILDEISHRAEQEIQSQPVRTQVDLTQQTRQIFNHYTKHGTATSLRSAITRYFKPSTQDNAGLSFCPPLPPGYVTPPDPKDSRMVDEEPRNLVRGMPFCVDRTTHRRASSEEGAEKDGRRAEEEGRRAVEAGGST